MRPWRPCLSVARRQLTSNSATSRCLFEELVEQHRVDLLVAHAKGSSFFVAQNQGWVYFGNFLGDETKLWRIFLVGLVMKCNMFKRQNFSLALFIGSMSFLNRREEVLARVNPSPGA